MTVHSKVGASSMYRWQKCPASVRLSEGIKSSQSVYAEEGTKAHDLAANLLLGNGPKEPVDHETAEAVMTYVNFVNELRKKVPKECVWIEQRFDLSSIHPGLFGTADAVIFNPEERCLYVVDYKHGGGISVEVKNNSQLLYYALGSLVSTGVLCDFVELVIVQPRCPHEEGSIRKWRIDSFELLDFAADLKDAVLRTEDPNAEVVPGDHCRFCPAAAICPALRRNAVQLAQLEFSPRFSYDPEQLSKALEWLPVLEGWIKNVRDFAYGEATHGRVPPGWKLVPKRLTRKFTDEDSVVKRATEQGKKEEIFETSMKSVAQIEKVFGKKKFEMWFGDLVVGISSGETLVPESDPREPLKLTAKQEFSVISDGDFTG